ncbi:MAG: DUF2188 domain-containing protein [Candidatus Moraniibacteriota bacterium]
MTNLHVVKSQKSWVVKEEKSSQLLSQHHTQENAIERASGIAREKDLEVFIHGRDGRIRERNTFGNDPFPPKG